ncbi:hypothetical protein DBV15_11344 [Temnothorax longispinosus]|uniref:Uncharacterized protein n=1 Tax=Temnothorax longispinosus TaxID=300112 RepID=A0A4S2KWS8_9HYME|nr:hypothetical protein DBV15_11344 [Temnothorax longispinosus]
MTDEKEYERLKVGIRDTLCTTSYHVLWLGQRLPTNTRTYGDNYCTPYTFNRGAHLAQITTKRRAEGIVSGQRKQERLAVAYTATDTTAVIGIVYQQFCWRLTFCVSNIFIYALRDCPIYHKLLLQFCICELILLLNTDKSTRPKSSNRDSARAKLSSDTSPNEASLIDYANTASSLLPVSASAITVATTTWSRSRYDRTRMMAEEAKEGRNWGTEIRNDESCFCTEQSPQMLAKQSRTPITIAVAACRMYAFPYTYFRTVQLPHSVPFDNDGPTSMMRPVAAVTKDGMTMSKGIG